MTGKSRPVVVAQCEVLLGDRLIPYVVKRSQVARQVRFEIRPDEGLAVIVPRRCSLDDVDGMVRSKSRWILGRIDRGAGRGVAAGDGRLKIGDSVPYLGRNLRLACYEGDGRIARIRLDEDTLTVHRSPGFSALEVLVECWYRAQAAGVLRRKALEHAGKLGVSYNKLVIRGQKTRWGSCSNKGTLSFNWRLMMAPEPVVDYVVIHEVAHLKEMNHTRRFWALVAERCAAWREHKKWLNDHGPELAALLNPLWRTV